MMVEAMQMLRNPYTKPKSSQKQDHHKDRVVLTAGMGLCIVVLRRRANNHHLPAGLSKQDVSEVIKQK